MWKQLLEFGGKLLSLMQRVARQEEAATELRQEVKELNEKLDQLTQIVQHLAFEIVRDRDKAERDREIQRLQLENALMRSERGLPPGNQKTGPQE